MHSLSCIPSESECYCWGGGGIYQSKHVYAVYKEKFRFNFVQATMKRNYKDDKRMLSMSPGPQTQHCG